jgi:hypothetical protein
MLGGWRALLLHKREALRYKSDADHPRDGVGNLLHG